MSAPQSLRPHYFWRYWRMDILRISSVLSALRRTSSSCRNLQASLSLSLFNFFFFLSSDFGGRQSWTSSCGFREKFHHLVCSSRIYLPLREQLIQMISTKARDHIEYSLKPAWANDGREPSLPKANEKLEKKRASSQSMRKWGWCG